MAGSRWTFTGPRWMKIVARGKHRLTLADLTLLVRTAQVKGVDPFAVVKVRTTFTGHVKELWLDGIERNA